MVSRLCSIDKTVPLDLVLHQLYLYKSGIWEGIVSNIWLGFFLQKENIERQVTIIEPSLYKMIDTEKPVQEN